MVRETGNVVRAVFCFAYQQRPDALQHLEVQALADDTQRDQVAVGRRCLRRHEFHEDFVQPELSRLERLDRLRVVEDWSLISNMRNVSYR